MSDLHFYGQQSPQPDDAERPELSIGVIDCNTLEQLIADLQTFADVQEVRVRTRLNVEPELCTLATCLSRLNDRSAIGVQVFYRFDDLTWLDTVMPQLEGEFRVVRMKLRNLN